MYAVVRQYSGSGASEVFEAIEGKKEEVKNLLRAVSGLISYSLIRTAEGGMSVTVCKDKTGTDESVRIASEWIKVNVNASVNPPAISEGTTIVQINS
tara:strand:+ start:362 stop:652 length:291 start_codon:yes stop_codon:yes gene_type:complete